MIINWNIIFNVIFIFTFTSLTFSYPQRSPTCDVYQMINGDHGAYFVNDTGGYALSQRRNADGKIEISIAGPNSIKGLLIYAHDVIGNRIGSFETKVKGVVPKTDCGGTGQSNTMQHSDNTLKSLPLTFTWSLTQDAEINDVYIE